MSKIALALGSFIIGICCTLAVISVTQAVAQDQSLKNEAVNIVGAEPTVPPLSSHMKGGKLGGVSQTLDGIDCDGCTIEVNTITYGGGAFSCKNCVIHLAKLNLTGAAWNTYNALRFFGIIPTPKPAPNPQNRPLLTSDGLQLVPREWKQSPQEKVDWVSLAGLSNH